MCKSRFGIVAIFFAGVIALPVFAQEKKTIPRPAPRETKEVQGDAKKRDAKEKSELSTGGEKEKRPAVPSKKVTGKLRGTGKSYGLIEGPDLTGPIGQGNSPVEIPDPAADEGKVEAGAPDLAYGAYQRGYYLTAFQLALPRAEAGDPAAQTLIAELYAKGLGIARDEKRAASWYRFAADGGDPEAQFAYANLIIQGKIFPLDKKLARDLMEKAAKSGHAKAQFNFAQMIIDERPTYAGFKKALTWYESAAKAGLPDAQYAYATILAAGNGIPVPRPEEARTWMTRSALGGFDTAQVELGIWLVNGKGGPKKPKEALKWFSRAAARGNVIAQNRLARMNAFGIGTPRDQVTAGGWHILSKRAGYSDSDLDQMFNGLSEIDKKRAIELANRYRLPLR